MHPPPSLTRPPLLTRPQVEQTANMNRAVQEYQHHARQDHRAALQRKQLIEARKEFIENQSKAKVRQARMQRIAEMSLATLDNSDSLLAYVPSQQS